MPNIPTKGLRDERAPGDKRAPCDEQPGAARASGRRKLFRALGIGGAGLFLVSKWSKPVVDSVILPLHAQASSTLLTGTFAGSGGTNGTLEVTIPMFVSATTRATFTVVAVLRVLGGGTVNLGGTFDDATGALVLTDTATGSTWSFTGTLSGGSASGTFSGPGTSGTFSVVNTNSNPQVTNYCGTYSGTQSGTWNATISAATGLIVGTSNGTDGGGSFSGALSGTTITVTTSEGSASGTLVGGVMSGVWSYNDNSNSGTFTGSAAACP